MLQNLFTISFFHCQKPKLNVLFEMYINIEETASIPFYILEILLKPSCLLSSKHIAAPQISHMIFNLYFLSINHFPKKSPLFQPFFPKKSTFMIFEKSVRFSLCSKPQSKILNNYNLVIIWRPQNQI